MDRPSRFAFLANPVRIGRFITQLPIIHPTFAWILLIHG